MNFLVVLALFVVSNFSISGIWEMPDKNHVLIYPTKNKVRVVLKLNSNCKKPIFKMFTGKISYKKNIVAIIAESKPAPIPMGKKNMCTSRFSFVAVGKVLNNPRRFKTKATIVSFIRCRDGVSIINSDDIGGEWKLVTPKKRMPSRKRIPNSGQRLHI